MVAMDEALRPAAVAAAQRLRRAGRRVDLLLEPKKMKWVFKVRRVCSSTYSVYVRGLCQSAWHRRRSGARRRWAHRHEGVQAAQRHLVTALCNQSGNLRHAAWTAGDPLLRKHGRLPACHKAACMSASLPRLAQRAPENWAARAVRIQCLAREESAPLGSLI